MAYGEDRAGQVWGAAAGARAPWPQRRALYRFGAGAHRGGPAEPEGGGLLGHIPLWMAYRSFAGDSHGQQPLALGTWPRAFDCQHALAAAAIMASGITAVAWSQGAYKYMG